MEAWIWWFIWLGLIIFALLYLGYIGWNLLAKANRAVNEIYKVAKSAEPLKVALEKPAEIAEFASNLLDDPAPLLAERARNLRKREAKRQERQRRLINKLIDYDESEFQP